MMIDDLHAQIGLPLFSISQCVVRERIPIEYGTVQNRIWYEGEKFLSYGDCFIQI